MRAWLFTVVLAVLGCEVTPAGGDAGASGGHVAGGAAGGITAGGTSGGIAGGASGGIGGGGTSGGISGGASGGVAGGASGGVAGGASGGVAGGASGGISGGASGGRAGGASGGVAGGTAGGRAGGTAGGSAGAAGGGFPSGSLAQALAADRGPSGTITALGTSTMETAVGTNPDKRFALPKVIAAWGTAALSVVKDSSGVVTEALYMVHGGGHNDTGYDGVLVYSFRNKRWTEAQQPSVLSPQDNSQFNTTYGENFAGTHVVSDHGYNSLVGIDSDEAGGPSIIKTQGGATGMHAIGSRQAHRFDLLTNTWSRFGQLGNVLGVSPVTVKDTQRHLIRKFGYSGTWNELDYAAAPTTAWVVGSQPAPNRGWSNVPTPCGVYDPVRDLYIGGIMTSAPNVMVVMPAANPSAAWVELRTSGVALPTTMISAPWHYRSAIDTFVFVDTRTSPATGIFEITPPASNPLTNTWTVQRRAFTGTSRYQRQYGSSDDDYHRWQYVPGLDALVANPWSNLPMEIWWL